MSQALKPRPPVEVEIELDAQPTPQNLDKLLASIEKILSDERRWTQDRWAKAPKYMRKNSYRRKRYGEEAVDVADPAAARFCLIGATQYVVYSIWGEDYQIASHRDKFIRQLLHKMCCAIIANVPESEWGGAGFKRAFEEYYSDSDLSICDVSSDGIIATFNDKKKRKHEDIMRIIAEARLMLHAEIEETKSN